MTRKGRNVGAFWSTSSPNRCGTTTAWPRLLTGNSSVTPWIAASTIAWKMSGMASLEDTRRARARSVVHGLRSGGRASDEAAHAAGPLGAPGLDLARLGAHQILADGRAALLDHVHRHAMRLFSPRALD